MSKAASSLVVNRAIINDRNQILLLQCSESDSCNANLWEFPGGKVGAGEEMMMVLNREVLEETGITIGNISSIAHVESEVVTSGKYTGRLYVALFYTAQRLGGELILSDEHSDASWEDPRRIATRALTLESRRAVQSLHGLKVI